ncbi:GPR endopeptidase [Rummeliibacillus suwonensis]|uniref:GPR endopeptidase n=1 Tax=Rummeliibacillus suwonensis TaxID=1306154 RepID=UPI0011B41B53|nr:GPR endopeptidase [Rummeliibacillus suwonensis]
MENFQWSTTDLVDETEAYINHKTEEERTKLRESNGIDIQENWEEIVKVTQVTVSKQGEEHIGKKEGTYITLSVPTLEANDQEGLQIFEESIVKALQKIHSKEKLEKILIIGLGNRTITPDAIGPLTIDHLHNQDEVIQDNCIIYAPGVTAQTGYETSEFVKALADNIQPSLVVIIDALATNSSERLCKTVQITNTGIQPGAGVGNSRKEISEDTMGCPVIAIGLPTVVDGPVLITDAVETLFRYISAKISEKDRPSSALSVSSFTVDENTEILTETLLPIFGEWVKWDKQERLQLFQEVLTGQQRLFVTPKNIDDWVSAYVAMLASVCTRWLSVA